MIKYGVCILMGQDQRKVLVLVVYYSIQREINCLLLVGYNLIVPTTIQIMKLSSKGLKNILIRMLKF